MQNSKTNEIVGLAVLEDDLHSLHNDVSVKDEKGCQMTSHILHPSILHSTLIPSEQDAHTFTLQCS